MSTLIILPNPDALAQEAAVRFVELAREAIAQRGRFVAALAGGSTPRATYSLLTREPFASDVDWSRVHLFWGDERCVSPDHPKSNYRMARETLLDYVPIPSENVHRIPGELAPTRAAAVYARELTAFLAPRDRFDLVLLGLGEDGHTASLFPGSPVLEERAQVVAAVYAEHLQSWRVTLTLSPINAARHVVFLVSGAAKEKALARVRAGEPLPAGLVRPTRGPLTWLVDRDAAGELATAFDGYEK